MSSRGRVIFMLNIAVFMLLALQIRNFIYTPVPLQYQQSVITRRTYKNKKSSETYNSNIKEIASNVLYELTQDELFPQISSQSKNQIISLSERTPSISATIELNHMCSNTGAADPHNIADSQGYICKVNIAYLYMITL